MYHGKINVAWQHQQRGGGDKQQHKRHENILSSAISGIIIRRKATRQYQQRSSKIGGVAAYGAMMAERVCVRGGKKTAYQNQSSALPASK